MSFSRPIRQPAISTFYGKSSFTHVEDAYPKDDDNKRLIYTSLEHIELRLAVWDHAGGTNLKAVHGWGCGYRKFSVFIRILDGDRDIGRGVDITGCVEQVGQIAYRVVHGSAIAFGPEKISSEGLPCRGSPHSPCFVSSAILVATVAVR